MGTSAPENGVRIHLLGEFRVCVGSSTIDHTSWRLRKVRALVKLLALAPRNRLHREQVLEVLWPDLAPEAAVNNLHQAAHIARRAIAFASQAGVDGYFRLRDQVLALHESRQLWVDVDAFDSAAAAALSGTDVVSYERALSLYTGELLPDDRYEEWTVEPRRTLQQQYLTLLLRVAPLYEQAGDVPGAIKALNKVVFQEPAHEDARTRLMRLYAQIGDQQAAVRQYHSLKTALEALDATPDPSTVTMARQIQSDRKPRGTRSPDSWGNFDGSSTSGNLPHSLDSFVGRKRELTELRGVLRRGRLLTLTGPGGSGKTRLALELARASAADYTDGVWWVDLQGLRDASLLPSVIASGLGVREEPARPVEVTLTGKLRHRNCLVILDNCEHLLGACSALVETLLRACPRLSVLATTRERLKVQGETRWPVLPLSVPPRGTRVSITTIGGYDAAALFIARGRSVKPHFALTAENAGIVAEICQRLDGLPLAIELAAGGMHSLSARQIWEKLDKRFQNAVIPGTSLPRYRTLAEAFGCSYVLLSEKERMVFDRLSVFEGGLSLDAAEGICTGSGIEQVELLDLLSELVEKSLVVLEETPHGTGRYRLLEPLREFARQKLMESEAEDEACRRHRDWFLRLAEGTSPNPGTPNWVVWLDERERERGNLRAALRWSLASADLESCLRLAVALAPFWLERGYWAEGREALEATLSLSGDTSQALRARALHQAATLANYTGDYAAASDHAGSSRRLYCRLGDKSGEMESLFRMAWTSRWQEERLDVSRQYFEEAMIVARELGSTGGIARALHGLGDLAWRRGDFENASALLGDALAIARASGDRVLLAELLNELGECELDQGHFEPARRLIEDGLRIYQEIGSKLGIASSLRDLGLLARAEGDNVTARSLIERAICAYREMGDGRQLPYALSTLAMVAMKEGAFTEACSLVNESLEICRAPNVVRGLRVTLRALAGLATAVGRPEDAAHLYGAERRLRERTQLHLSASEQIAHEEDLDTLRKELGEGGLHAAETSGAAIPLERIMEYATSVAQGLAIRGSLAIATHTNDWPVREVGRSDRV